MTARWKDTLPPVISYLDPREHGELALYQLTVALRWERLGERGNLLRSVRYAATYVRAWRLSLPKDEQGQQASAALVAGDRVHIHDALRFVIQADMDWHPATSLRFAEAALRELGKRLMAEVES